MTVAADALTGAALAGDLGRVRDLLRDLDETQRRALRAELKSVTTELRRTGRLWEHLRSYDALGLGDPGVHGGCGDHRDPYREVVEVGTDEGRAVGRRAAGP